MKLEGSTALITGGASGIGLAIAAALRDAGARPILADIDEEELVRAADALGGAGTIRLDVTDRAQWTGARERLGIVDILVNNAGIGPDGRTFADMDPVAFDRMVAFNLTSVFNGVSTFAAGMRQRGSGHILNTASMAGLTASATIGAYTAAKFAIVGMSEVLRADLAPHGVGVSVLCPGLVATRLHETTRRAGSETLGGGASISASLSAMDPAVVGRLAAAGIRDDTPLIVTHAEYRGAVAARGERLVAAFDTLSQAGSLDLGA